MIIAVSFIYIKSISSKRKLRPKDFFALPLIIIGCIVALITAIYGLVFIMSLLLGLLL